MKLFYASLVLMVAAILALSDTADAKPKKGGGSKGISVKNSGNATAKGGNAKGTNSTGGNATATGGNITID